MEAKELQTAAEFEIGRRSVSGAPAQIALFLIFFEATRFRFDHPLQITLFAVLIILGNTARFWLGLRQAAFYPAKRQIWIRAYLGALLTAVSTWGVLFYQTITYYGTHSFETSIALLLGSGLAAAFTLSLTPIRSFAQAMLLILLGIPAFALFRQFNHESIAMAGIVGIFWIFLWNQLRIHNLVFWKNLASQRGLEHEKVRLQAVLDAIPALVAWTGADLGFHGVNKTFAQNYQKVPSEFLGKSLTGMVDDSELLEAVQDFTTSGRKEDTREIDLSTHQGKRRHLLVMRRINGEAYLICIDIHELKDAQAQLEDHRGKLEAAAKMAALGQVAANIAHEIRNPLAVVTSSIELARVLAARPGGEPKKLGTALNHALDAANRINKIISGLTRFSRSQEKEPLVVSSLNQIVRDSVDLIQPQFRANRVILNVAPIDDELQIRSRPTEISQVLVNLLQNALDAVKEQSNQRWVMLTVSRENDQIKLSVIDSGPGIPREVQERLFKTFFTTKPPGQGTGLGLSISRRIIIEHEGQLEIDSTAPHTTFDVRLRAVSQLEIKKAA